MTRDSIARAARRGRFYMFLLWDNGCGCGHAPGPLPFARLDVPDRSLKMAEAPTTTTQVNGGFITREERTGKLIEVRTDKGTSRSSEKTVAAAKLAAELDRDALARLAKR
jgi:hypothetical protein